MAWQDSAACRGRTDLTWFPVGLGRRSPDYQRQIDAAVEVCRTCPVIGPCRDAGRREQGVWGGQFNAPPRLPRQLAPCGTPAAYRRHQRIGEEPCDRCVTAFRVWLQEQRDKRSYDAASRVRSMLGRTG